MQLKLRIHSGIKWAKWILISVVNALAKDIPLSFVIYFQVVDLNRALAVIVNKCDLRLPIRCDRMENAVIDSMQFDWNYCEIIKLWNGNDQSLFETL